MPALLLALALFFQQAQHAGPTYSGTDNNTNIDIPRIEAAATIDGVLTDEVWSQAARLTDFSQYQPVDGRPAAEPTEVYVYYAPDAIYFGVRAFNSEGNVVRATQANRDNIASEDHGCSKCGLRRPVARWPKWHPEGQPMCA